MSTSVICPIYNGQHYIVALNDILTRQIKVDDLEIIYLLTVSNDNSEEILKELNAKYKVIKKEEFSHSLSREKAAYESNSDIVVFITQDIIIEDEEFIYKLTKDIVSGVCDATFARQICENKSIERYTRMNNYPDESRIVSKEHEKILGIQTYFFSDAASAIKRDTFIKLNGYDKKNLLTNEDMYFAYKLINSGYKIKYCSKAKVIHSHDYSYKSLFKRYFDQGVFLKEHEYIEKSGAGSSALTLLKFVVINALKEKNYRVLLKIVPNFGVRFIANKIGHRFDKLSKKKILKYTSNPAYWMKEVYSE